MNQPELSEQEQFAQVLARMEELQRTNPAALAEAMNALNIPPDKNTGAPHVGGLKNMDSLAQLTESIMSMRAAQQQGDTGGSAEAAASILHQREAPVGDK